MSFSWKRQVSFRFCRALSYWVQVLFLPWGLTFVRQTLTPRKLEAFFPKVCQHGDFVSEPLGQISKGWLVKLTEGVLQNGCRWKWLFIWPFVLVFVRNHSYSIKSFYFHVVIVTYLFLFWHVYYCNMMPLTKSTIETMKPPPVPARAFGKSWIRWTDEWLPPSLSPPSLLLKFPGENSWRSGSVHLTQTVWMASILALSL